MYCALRQGIERGCGKRGVSAKGIGIKSMSAALYTRNFQLCLAKLHESLKFTTALAAPLAFGLPANTQLPGPGIPACSASPLLPLVLPQKTAHGFGETTRDCLEETSRK